MGQHHYRAWVGVPKTADAAAFGLAWHVLDRDLAADPLNGGGQYDLNLLEMTQLVLPPQTESEFVESPSHRLGCTGHGEDCHEV